MEGISNGLRHLISYPGVLGSKACSCCLPFGCCFCKSHPKLINSPCHEPKSRVQQRLSSSRRQSRSHSSRSQLQTFPAVIWASALAAQAESVLELCCWSGACGVTSLWLPEELCSWLGEPTPHPKGHTAGAGECAGHTGSWWLCLHRAATCDAGECAGQGPGGSVSTEQLLGSAQDTQGPGGSASTEQLLVMLGWLLW